MNTFDAIDKYYCSFKSKSDVVIFNGIRRSRIEPSNILNMVLKQMAEKIFIKMAISSSDKKIVFSVFC